MTTVGTLQAQPTTALDHLEATPSQGKTALLTWRDEGVVVCHGHPPKLTGR
jgi:hypothetical protein